MMFVLLFVGVVGGVFMVIGIHVATVPLDKR